MSRFLLLFFILQGLLLSLRAEPPSLSILSGEETAPLAALLTTRLSGTYQLNERDYLIGIISERELLTDTPPVLQLSGSDALLFLSHESDGSIRARLVSTGLGHTVFEHIYPDHAPEEQVAQHLGSRLDSLAPKLSRPQQKAIPLAVLNLRLDYATADAAILEARATLLLEHRLIQIPEVIVLERRRSNAVAFERTLTPTPQKLLPGVYLLDGSLSRTSDTLTARLRLRSPEGNIVHSFHVEAPDHDLPALVNRIARKLSDYWKLPHPSPAATTAEAREFLLEGIWAFQRRLYPLAIASLDNAELLGETASDLFAIRALALCRAASPPTPESPGEPARPEPAHSRMLRAMDDLTRYRELQGPKSLQLLNHRTGTGVDTRVSRMSERLFRETSKLLVYFERHQRPHATSLRKALRHHAGFAPEEGKLSYTPVIALEYASLWANSLEEECVFYTHYTSSHQQMLRDFGNLPKLVTPQTFGYRFLPDPEARHAAYLAYWKKEANHPDRAIHALYLLALHAPPDEKEAACHAYYEWLWQHRAALLERKLLSAPLTRAFRLETARARAEADPRLIDSLIYFLTNTPQPKGQVYPSWNPLLFPKERFGEIQTALRAYRQRMTGSNQRRADQYGERVAATLALSFPTPQPATGISITRFWMPDDFTNHPYFHQLSEAGGDAVIVGYDPLRNESATLFRICLSTFRSEAVPIPHPNDFGHAVELEQALYLPSFRREEIARYDLRTKQWSRFPVPGIISRLYASHGQLYGVTRTLVTPHDESSIIRINPRTGQTHLLASSRRRPALSPFDDRESYVVQAIFPAPQGQTYAVISSRVHEVRDTPGGWPILPGTHRVLGVFCERGYTLIRTGIGEKNRTEAVYVIRPDRAEPESWLGPLSDDPDAPAWLTHAHWLATGSAEPQPYHYGTHGDNLIAFTHDQDSSTLSLLYYRRGHTIPITIPLHFAMDKATTVKLNQGDWGEKHKMIVQNPASFGIPACRFYPDGIAIRAISSGFWFLPFSEITAYVDTLCLQD